MANRSQRSVLTASQQGHVRASMMRTAAQIAHQLHEYITAGTIKVAGREVVLTTERLASYRLVLDRTIPTLNSTEITHKSGLEAMTTEQIMTRLTAMVATKPELKQQLMEALGGRVIEGAVEPAPDPVPAKPPVLTVVEAREDQPEPTNDEPMS